MRQLVQSVRSGDLRIVNCPDPVIGPTEVLVQTTHSVISAGTERAVRNLASASLLSKARARPDLVRQVINKARREGIRNTISAVQSRLDEDMPLGYSAAGTVIEVGEYVAGVRPGMRVATGGAGHADLQVVAGQLTVPIPDSVSDEQASFATVASIALHGLRLAEVGPGGKVCIIGLGLIGQLTTRLALAAGLDVVGIDLREWTTQRISPLGAMGLVESGQSTTEAVIEWSRGRGVDAVLLTAATESSEPVNRAAAIARDRANLVVVGDVGLNLQRPTLYERELTVKIARSYGPGRYERSYEQWGVDYPIGHVRWTEGRNLEAVLDLLSSKKLAVDDLITHRFAFADAIDAYSLLSKPSEKYLGVQLKYPAARERHTFQQQSKPSSAPSTAHRIGLIGAGNFAREVIVPSINSSGIGQITLIASAGGASAQRLALDIGATAVTPDELLADPSIDIAVIATSHDSHAELTIRALNAGKHVFCEKPLAITEDQLDAVRVAWEQSGRHLAVGFNRRHSRWTKLLVENLPKSGGPISIIYRIAATALPDVHWYHDRMQGGRLLGEVCHFIDTCNFIVGLPSYAIQTAGGSSGETIASSNLAVQIAYPDGSTASIAYCLGAHSSTPKEFIEVLGRGKSLRLDDFRALSIDNRTIRGVSDKGHQALWVSFRDGIRLSNTPEIDDTGTMDSLKAFLGLLQRSDLK